jgi:hypothetical protein
MTGRRVVMLLLVAAVGSLVACDRVSAPHAPADELYTAAPGAVGLDIVPAANSEGTSRWLATYSDGTTTTKFQIEFNHTTSAGNNLLASGKGRFVSLAGSDPTPLLDALQEAMEARHRPKSAKKVDALPFEYVLIGDHQTRLPDGSFSSNPKGNWTTTKLFLANEQAQVYFNFNLVIHKAEFSIKDREYGDRLVAEFAKVL